MKTTYTPLKSIIFFLLILILPQLSKSQNWVVGSPVNMVVSTNLFHSNFCFPTPDQHFTVNGSTISGIDYYLYVDSAPLDSVYIFPGMDTLATGDSILIPAGSNYFALYFFHLGGLLNISIKAVGVPTTTGQLHPCESSDLWSSDLMLCDEGLSPIINNNCQVMAIGVDIFGTNSDCFESCTGIADASINGGTSPFSYLWNTGETTASINSLCAGIYSVIVTDAGGSSATDSVTITSPPTIVVDTFITDASCITCADGSITIVVSGGVPPYEISWNNNDSTATTGNLLPGEYLYMITDSNGCITKSPVTVGAASGIKNINRNDLLKIYPNPVADDLFISINQNHACLIEIKDLLERIIKTSDYINYKSEFKINVGELPSGIYFISVQLNDGNTVIKQFVKE